MTDSERGQAPQDSAGLIRTPSSQVLPVAAGHDAPQRVILLGASNVARSFATVVAVSGTIWGRPLEIMAAIGHGRSYGRRTTCFGRSLPGIAECGLWKSLDARPHAQTAALVTDVGNDLLYDTPVAVIRGWVESCLDRLAKHDARIVMTQLPVANMHVLSPRRFLFFRRVFFPNCNLGLEQVVDRALELNVSLVDLAASRGIPMSPLRPEWYGMDPIHIRLQSWSSAWSEILSAWQADQRSSIARRASFAQWLYLRSLAPEQRWLLGREQRRVQPAARYRDGTTVSLY